MEEKKKICECEGCTKEAKIVEECPYDNDSYFCSIEHRDEYAKGKAYCVSGVFNLNEDGSRGSRIDTFPLLTTHKLRMEKLYGNNWKDLFAEMTDRLDKSNIDFNKCRNIELRPGYAIIEYDGEVMGKKNDE